MCCWRGFDGTVFYICVYVVSIVIVFGKENRKFVVYFFFDCKMIDKCLYIFVFGWFK